MQGTKPALEQPLQQATELSSSVALVPTDRAVTGPARSLSEIEDFLAAMVESAELVTSEQIAEYLADLGETHEVALAKRDRCAQAIFRYEEMVDLIDARVAHLQQRIDQLRDMAQHVKAEQERFEKYLISVVDQYGVVPKRAKNKRLEGKVFALALAVGPDSVLIENEADVPKEFKQVTVKLSLPVYERLVELGFTQGYTETDMPQGTVVVSKKDVKKALDEKREVPGADLEFGKTRLEVKARKG